MFLSQDIIKHFILDHCIVESPPGEQTEIYQAQISNGYLTEKDECVPMYFIEHCVIDIIVAVTPKGCVVNFLIRNDYKEIFNDVFHRIEEFLQLPLLKYNEVTQFASIPKEFSMGIYFWDKDNGVYDCVVDRIDNKPYAKSNRSIERLDDYLLSFDKI